MKMSLCVGNLILPVLITILSFFISFESAIVFAHPGRTDSSGCHTCRTNCPNWGLSYGEYHCHRSKGIPQPTEPIKSHLDNSGVGYTTPAPEYKISVTTQPSMNFVQTKKAQEGWFKNVLRVFGM